MTLQEVNLGFTPNDGGGDPLRVALEKLSDNDQNIADEFVAVVARKIEVIANVAALRACSPADLVGWKGIQLLGYYSSGDGGGGNLYIDLTDTTTADDGGACFVVGGVRIKADFGECVNALRFGAKPDGVTDCTAAIQAAFNARAGRVVRVPAGTYYLVGTISLINSPEDKTIFFKGDGRADSKGTVFVKASNNTQAFIVDGSAPDIGGFMVKWQSRALTTDTNAIGIQIRNVWNGTFYQIEVRNAYIDWELQNTYQQFSNLFYDCSTYGFTRRGLSCAGTSTQNQWLKTDIRNYGIPTSATGSASNVGPVVTITGLPTSWTDRARVNMVIGVTGLSPAEFNGGATITAVSPGQISYQIGVAPSGPVTGTATVDNLVGVSTGECVFIGSGSFQVFHGLNLEWTNGPRMFTANEYVSIYGLHLEGFTGDGTASSFMRFAKGGEIFGFDLINCSVTPGTSYSLFEVADGTLIMPSIRTRDLCYTGATLNWYFGAGYMTPPRHFKEATLRWDRTSEVPGYDNLRTVLSLCKDALTGFGVTGTTDDCFAWDPVAGGNKRLTIVGNGLQATTNDTGAVTSFTVQINSSGSGGFNVFGIGVSGHNAFEFIPTSTDRRLRFGDTYINSVINSTGAERLLTLQNGHTSQGLGIFTLSVAAGAAAFIPTTDDERIHFTGSRIDGYQNSTGVARVALDLNLGSFVVVDNIRYANSSGPQDLSGNGAPSASVPNGSTYRRTDGTGPNFYVRENGVWVAK